MSRHTYAGPFKNPTEGFYVKAVRDHFEVWIREDRNTDGSAPPDRRHAKSPKFEEAGDAQEWIDGLYDFYEEDYDQYLEENHLEIVRMEQYEAFLNER